MQWTWLKSLSPSWRRRQEQEMREELEALSAIAGRREIGGIARPMEEVRASWGWTWIESLVADVRYAFRALRAQPAFFGVAVLSLGLAIGANSAMFSFADALLLRPLPVPKASALLDVISTTPDNPFEGMSYPDYRDLREKSRTLDGLAAYRLTTVAAATNPTGTARVRLAVLVSDNFFPVVGVSPTLGRSFLPEEATGPGEARALISHDLWQQEYAGDPMIAGRPLRLNGIPFTIVGVLPDSFTGLDRFVRPTIYVPLAMSQLLEGAKMNPLEDRGVHNLVVKARLGAPASLKSAQAEVAAVGASLEKEYPKTNRNRRPEIRTEMQRRVQQTPQLVVLGKMLLGLVALILIVACSNVANLLLARGSARSREVSVRLSIGAGRGRLVRQLMTESLILALAGGAVGLFFAYGGIRLLQTMSVPSEPPSYLGVQMDWRVVEFSFAAAVVSCLVFGLVPAWRAARLDLAAALKGDAPGSARATRTLGRDGLVIGQIALAMVVLMAAAMFFTGFRKMLATAPDFRTDHLLTMDTAPAMLHYPPEKILEFYRRLSIAAKALPGVESVAMTESLPLSTSQTTLTVSPEGYQFPRGQEKTVVFGSSVDAGYFSTLDVAILQGRAFTVDDRAESRRVAVVNEQFAKTYWPGQNPVGKRIRVDSPEGPAAEVVGVAKTGHYLLVNEPPAPYVYLPYEQNPRPRMTLAVQTSGDAGTLAARLRQAVRSIDTDMPVYNLRTMATLYESRATGTWLEFFRMTGAIGLIGLALAVTGLYGLIAYTVSRRLKEFGIRIATGARYRDLVWLVERRALVLAGLGIIAGGVLTAAAAPLLTASFVGLEPPGVRLIATVPFGLLAIGAVASFLPARRAARLDPLRVLRNE